MEALFRFKRKYLPGFHPLQIPVLGPSLRKLIQLRKKSEVVVQGHRMFLDKNDSLMLSARESYEPQITQFFNQHIQAGDTVIDIGANIGYFTLLFAKKVGTQGQVVAFEPGRENFELLRKNVEVNRYQNVVLKKLALSDQPGKAQLYLNHENSGDHQIIASQSGRECEEIELQTLDNLVEELQLDASKIKFIKMDIQGAEFNALKGMRNLCATSQQLTLVTEFWPLGLKRAGASGLAYYHYLRELGFQIYTANEDRGTFEPTQIESLLNQLGEREDSFADLFCCKGTDPLS